MLRRLSAVLALCALGVSAGCVTTPSLSGPEVDLAHDALASAEGLADYLQAVTPETIADVVYSGQARVSGGPLKDVVRWTDLRFGGGGGCTVASYVSRDAAREAGKIRCAGFNGAHRRWTSRQGRRVGIGQPGPTGQVCHVYGAQAVSCALPGRSAAHLAGALRALVELDARSGLAALPECETPTPIGALAALIGESSRGLPAPGR